MDITQESHAFVAFRGTITSRSAITDATRDPLTLIEYKFELYRKQLYLERLFGAVINWKWCLK